MSQDRVIVLRARRGLQHKLTARSIIVASGILILLLSVPTVMRVVSDQYMYRDIARIPNADAVLIPGASVVRGGLSPVFAARAEQALELYRAGKVKRFLISGDIEPNYDEVTPVRDFLVSEGVPKEHIFLDAQGYDTYSSMYRARWVYGAKRLIVVSQDFHLPRTVFVGRSLGIDAYGRHVLRISPRNTGIMESAAGPPHASAAAIPRRSGSARWPLS
jgi:SanA protein